VTWTWLHTSGVDAYLVVVYQVFFSDFKAVFDEGTTEEDRVGGKETIHFRHGSEREEPKSWFVRMGWMDFVVCPRVCM
jgi:hypothetical protein